MEHSMEKTNKINNTFYDHYGDRWYYAYDDPVALLRAENEIKFPWILEKINSNKIFIYFQYIIKIEYY